MRSGILFVAFAITGAPRGGVGFTVITLFVMLLVRHYVVAGVFALLVLLVLAAWHWKEPQDQ